LFTQLFTLVRRGYQ